MPKLQNNPNYFHPASSKFCEIDGIWPKTPASTTVVSRVCEQGRVGFQERTCEGDVWKKPFSSCIKEELNKVLNVAAVSMTLAQV